MHRHFWGLLNILSINFHHHVLFNRTISYRSCGINFQSIPKPLRLCGFGKVGLFPLASAACHLLSGVICYSSFYEFARAAAAGLTCDVSFLRHYNQQVTTLKVHLLRHYTSVPQKKKINLYWYLKVVEFCCALVNAQIQKTHTHCQTNCPTKSCDQRVSSKPA